MLEVSLFILYGSAFALFLCERARPAHASDKSQKARRQWYVRALIINAINLTVFFVIDIGMSWCAVNGYLTGGSILQLMGFELHLQSSPVKAAFLAYFIFTFVVYWWHRARHSNKFLWRWFHQLHHSPEQIEVLTAYYIHPLDLIANLIISNGILYLLLGADFSAAPLYTLITGLAGLIIHADVSLPRWIGYIFQTPQMHRLHHKRGHHAHNYTDLVCWDMLFGTYLNPKEPIQHCGFAQPRNQRLRPLLCGQDVETN